MTVELLVSIAAAAVSLLFEYVPGFSHWFDGLTDPQKRMAMAIMMFLVALGVFGLNCSGYLLPGVPTVSCDAAGGWSLVSIWLLALISNQVTHMITRRPAPSLS